MQKKFLEDLGISAENIDKILAENSGDIEKIQSQLDETKKKLSDTETQYQTKISDMQFNSILDTAISASKARNSKAVKALLDLETLKSSKNQSEDIKSALEKIKSENDYLFEGTSIPGGGANPPSGTNPNTNPLPKGTVIF